MSGDELKAKVIKFTEESWNKGNLDVMDEIFAKDVICHAPSVQDEKGLEAYKNRLTDTRTDYPDFHVTIDKITSKEILWPTDGHVRPPSVDQERLRLFLALVKK